MTRTNEAGEARTASATGATTPVGDAQPVYPHTMRLQRFLARAGVASRRGSEDLMTAGRVTVNGKVARASYDVKAGDRAGYQGRRRPRPYRGRRHAR